MSFRVSSTWNLLVCRVDSVQTLNFRGQSSGVTKFTKFKSDRMLFSIMGTVFDTVYWHLRRPIFRVHLFRTKIFDFSADQSNDSIDLNIFFKQKLQDPSSVFECFVLDRRKFWKISCRHWGASDSLIARQVPPRVPLLDLNFVSPDSQRLLIHYLVDFRVR